MAKKKYSKNPLTLQNIIWYLVIGGIVYGLIYYVFMGKKAGSMYQTGNTMTVVLNAQNASGETGTATLIESAGKTTVDINLSGAPSNLSQPAHIHAGACPTPGNIIYPLTNVVNGASKTVLDVDLATLRAQLPLAVNVHKSASEAKVYVSCGDLK